MSNADLIAAARTTTDTDVAIGLMFQLADALEEAEARIAEAEQRGAEKAQEELAKEQRICAEVNESNGRLLKTRDGLQARIAELEAERQLLEWAERGWHRIEIEPSYSNVIVTVFRLEASQRSETEFKGTSILDALRKAAERQSPGSPLAGDDK